MDHFRRGSSSRLTCLRRRHALVLPAVLVNSSDGGPPQVMWQRRYY